MPLKLKELDRFLGNGKMHFERRDEGPHLGFIVRLAGQRLGLPTVLRVSHGSGDAAFGNIKGVATALGLNVRELENAEACHLRRECVLLLLAAHMMQFAVDRRACLRDQEAGLDGVKAMAESVRTILGIGELQNISKWKSAELKAFGRVRDAVEKFSNDSLLAEQATAMLAHFDKS
jgi:hypothetical protein